MRATRRVIALLATCLVPAAALAACSSDNTEVSTRRSTTSSSSSSNETVSTAACPVTDTGSKTGSGSDAVSLLTAVRTGRHSCADRVTFEFRDGAPPAYTVEYQKGPFAMGESGQPLAIQGTAFLVVRFPHASGLDLTSPSASRTYTGPASLVPSGLAHVREVRRLEDFEAVLVWVIGLDATRPFSVNVLTSPPRIYVDIA